MENCNELLISGEAYCFSDRESVFVVYLKQGGEASLDLSQLEGRFSVNWYNPRSGGSLLEGSKAEVRGGQVVKLGKAPAEHKEDWAILLQKM